MPKSTQSFTNSSGSPLAKGSATLRKQNLKRLQINVGQGFGPRESSTSPLRLPKKHSDNRLCSLDPTRTQDRLMNAMANITDPDLVGNQSIFEFIGSKFELNFKICGRL